MFFLQIAQSPVVVRFGTEYEAVIPKYTLAKAVAWGAAIAAKWEKDATSGLSLEKRVEHLTFYPTIPPTLQNLKQMTQTIAGASEIVTESLKSMTLYRVDAEGVRGEQVTDATELKQVRDAVLANAGSGPLCHLAFELADVRDLATVSSQKTKPPVDDENGASPLTGSESGT